MRADGAKESFRQAMSWLHTWAGLLVGWLLFAIFLSGTLAFFKLELNHWSRPELHRLGPAQPLDSAVLARAEASLHRLAPAAQNWRLSLPDERRPVAALSWREAPDPTKPGQRAKFEQRWLDPASGAPVEARATFGAGEFFYRFHFELRSAQQSRWILEGRWLVGLATLLMFVALLSGIVTHRRFFKDFFTFRPRAKAAQRAWLDAHNISGVLALPFYLLITFSGLMTLHSLYMPSGIAAAYGKNSGAYFSELAGDPLPRNSGLTPKSDETEPLPLLGKGAWDRLLSQARAEWPDGRVEAVSLLRKDGQTLVEFNRHEGDRLQYRSPRQVFDAGSGERLHLADTDAPVAKTYGVLYGLHIARFAGMPLRWLLFGFGLLGSAMIATGLVLWCVKRHAEAERRGPAPLGFGRRLVAVLNIASIAGLPLAMAGFLYANRLLPLGLAQRPDAELKVFFAVWSASLLIAMAGGGWRLVFGLGALAFAGLPLLDLLHARALPQGMLLGIDLALLAAAVLLGYLAWKVRPAAAQQARPGPAGHVEGA